MKLKSCSSGTWLWAMTPKWRQPRSVWMVSGKVTGDSIVRSKECGGGRRTQLHLPQGLYRNTRNHFFFFFFFERARNQLLTNLTFINLKSHGETKLRNTRYFAQKDPNPSQWCSNKKYRKYAMQGDRQGRKISHSQYKR